MILIILSLLRLVLLTGCLASLAPHPPVLPVERVAGAELHEAAQQEHADDGATREHKAELVPSLLVKHIGKCWGLGWLKALTKSQN